MINIGILQDEKGEAIHNLMKDILKYATNLNIGHIDLINPKTIKYKYNILIFGKNVEDFNINNILCTKGIVVLNIDEKFYYPIRLMNPVKIITYGFNSKACITISSVINGSYDTIQLCIQRSISTLNGQLLEPQEFPINTQNKNVINVLSVVAVAILSGYRIDDLGCKLFMEKY